MMFTCWVAAVADPSGVDERHAEKAINQAKPFGASTYAHFAAAAPAAAIHWLMNAVGRGNPSSGDNQRRRMLTFGPLINRKWNAAS